MPGFLRLASLANAAGLLVAMVGNLQVPGADPTPPLPGDPTVVHELDSSTRARTRIEQVLREAQRIDLEPRLAVLTAAAKEVYLLVVNNPLSQQILEDAVAASTREAAPEAAAEQLQNALQEVHGILGFQPRSEAPLPAGFPVPTPVGEVQVQDYPAYRLARTTMAAPEKQDQAFFTLFQHISQNRIAMTAPVEMTYGSDDGKLRGETMAFLYQKSDIGETGDAGKVEVIDVPPMKAVSLGLHGDDSRDRIRDARAILESWLRRHSDRYEVAGPLRVLGYNSPMVPVNQRYFEVQLPVRMDSKDVPQPQ